mmetsp:Transcript_50955/g.110678  ORF Transcript_50955/g.110678 Transcript_50955/m.110678 type:complete len:250 (-) Transcript_50955:597-1346(-)
MWLSVHLFNGRLIAARRACRAAATRLRGGVDSLEDREGDVLEILAPRVVLVLLGALVVVEPLEGVIDSGVHGRLIVFTHGTLHPVLRHRRAQAVDVALKRVARLHLVGVLLVLLPVLLLLAHHLLDLLVAQPTLLGLDRDLLAPARALLVGRHLQDAVGVDVESDLDLRPSARHRRDAVEVELAQNVVVLGETALALVHLDVDPRLVVRVGAERLRLPYRNSRLPRDDIRHQPARRLNAQRERRHVNQE